MLLLDGRTNFFFGSKPVVNFGTGLATAVDVQFVRPAANLLFEL
ncbi:MAG TPA: hypothetical protein VFL57_18775 [Bryobacteraceae bacterium]|nr:hypothetical protein [Bryobacteraceae bacterium]